MRFRQPWLWLVLAGCTWTRVADAQTGVTPAASPASPLALPTGPAAPGATGNPAMPSPFAPRPTPAAPTSGTTTSEEKEKEKEKEDQPVTPPPLPSEPVKPKPANPFGFDDPTPSTDSPRRNSILTPGQNANIFNPNNSSSAFGMGRQPEESSEGVGGQPRTRPNDNPITYTAPGFFGSARQSFTAGQGRFAKPRFRYGASFGMGFDDNYTQSSGFPGTADTVVVQTIPEVPELATFRTYNQYLGLRYYAGRFNPIYKQVREKIVLRPYQPEQQIDVPVPGIPAQPVRSSVVSTFDATFNTQWAKAREALTFDLRLGAEYYFDRESDPLDYNGMMSLFYVKKYSSRMQLSINGNISYQTQPDFSQINVNTDLGGSAVTNGLLKADLSYRWTPRFSTNTSLASQAVFYEKGGVNAQSNFYDLTLGNEFRYTASPRTTYVAEGRVGTTTYLDTDELNSSSVYLLVGMDQRWNRRLLTTIRLGQVSRSFDAGGEQTSPYGELSASYQPNSRSQFTLSSRYGFEATSAANQENVVFRTTINYNRVLTPRLNGTLGVTYLDGLVTSEGPTGTTEFENSTFDASIGLTYRFNRKFSLSSRYNYTSVTQAFSEYDRSRFFLTGTYDF